LPLFAGHGRKFEVRGYGARLQSCHSILQVELPDEEACIREGMAFRSKNIYFIVAKKFKTG
jgi:hypothetical protein